MAVKITELRPTIREIVNGYKDSGQGGVVALGGKLNVRPAYQREFVYDKYRRDRVNHSVYNGLPLNSMYWAKNPDGTYEVIDGQQRIISICQFITNDDGEGNPIAINFNGKHTQTFNNLGDKKEEIYDYKLNVYVCEGTPDEKLEWFHTIISTDVPKFQSTLSTVFVQSFMCKLLTYSAATILLLPLTTIWLWISC